MTTSKEDKGRQLYELMVNKGYPPEFAKLVARELHTEFTASRMMGYILARDLMPLEEVADEMLAILSDRDRIIQKHMAEQAQQGINEYYRSRPADEDEEADDEGVELADEATVADNEGVETADEGVVSSDEGVATDGEIVESDTDMDADADSAMNMGAIDRKIRWRS